MRNERYQSARRATFDAVRLGELREARKNGWVQVAETPTVNVSRLETGGDLYVSALQGYVAALGGQLELRAVFPDEVVLIDVAVKDEALRDS